MPKLDLSPAGRTLGLIKPTMKHLQIMRFLLWGFFLWGFCGYRSPTEKSPTVKTSLPIDLLTNLKRIPSGPKTTNEFSTRNAENYESKAKLFQKASFFIIIFTYLQLVNMHFQNGHGVLDRLVPLFLKHGTSLPCTLWSFLTCILESRDCLRVFVQVEHQITYASIGNNHFFTK